MEKKMDRTNKWQVQLKHACQNRNIQSHCHQETEQLVNTLNNLNNNDFAELVCNINEKDKMNWSVKFGAYLLTKFPVHIIYFRKWYIQKEIKEA